MKPFVTAEFLRGPYYPYLMGLHVPAGPIDAGEAQAITPSYRLRHLDLAPLLGVWRWRGMQRHAGRILAALTEPGEGAIDFGGAGGPLGLGSVVVDFAARDALGNPIDLHALADVQHDPAAVVFTSHTLEHVPDLDAVLAQIRDCLVPGGLLIAHVPAWTCVRWRVGVHVQPEHGNHVWDFGLQDEAPIAGLLAYTNVAARIAGAGLAVELAEYCGDDSIMVMARRAP